MDYRVEEPPSWHDEPAGQLSRADAAEVAVFGAGVLATALAAVVAGWRLLVLVMGGG
jgi:hypothetical protein